MLSMASLPSSYASRPAPLSALRTPSTPTLTNDSPPITHPEYSHQNTAQPPEVYYTQDGGDGMYFDRSYAPPHHHMHHQQQAKPAPSGLPNHGQTRCYWALVSDDFRFLFLDPVLSHHMGPQANALLGQPLLDFIHPDDKSQASIDWAAVVDKRNVHGTVTQLRYLRLNRARAELGCANPYSEPEAYIYCLDENYLVCDIALSYVGARMLLCFFHAKIDKTQNDNDEMHKSTWTNWCGAPAAVPASLAEDIYTTLSLGDYVSCVPSRATPPERVFQILGEHDRSLKFSWPMQGMYNPQEFVAIAKNVTLESLPPQADGKAMGLEKGQKEIAPRTSCTRRYKATWHGMFVGGLTTVVSVYVPYGSLIFACHLAYYSWLPPDPNSDLPALTLNSQGGVAVQQPPLPPPQPAPAPPQATFYPGVGVGVGVPYLPYGPDPRLPPYALAYPAYAPPPPPPPQQPYAHYPPSTPWQQQQPGALPSPPLSSTRPTPAVYPPAPSHSHSHSHPHPHPHPQPHAYPPPSTSPTPATKVDSPAPARSPSEPEKEKKAGGTKKPGPPPEGVTHCIGMVDDIEKGKGAKKMCCSTMSPEWRKGWNGDVKDLCNACGLKYSRQKAKECGAPPSRRVAKRVRGDTPPKGKGKRRKKAAASTTAADVEGEEEEEEERKGEGHVPSVARPVPDESRSDTLVPVVPPMKVE